MKPSVALPALACALLGAAAIAASSGTRRRKLSTSLQPASSRLQPGQVILITGGSRGLGLALAHRFGRAGLRLALTARSSEELEQARHALVSAGDARPEDILLIPADLTDRAQCVHAVESTIAHFGALDVLLNNAGIIEVGAILDQPLAAYDRAMSTNFFAALHTTYAALPHMVARRAGAIVNIASIGGKIPVPHLAPYVAAKFALTGFSETLHAELREHGIRVTTVCPGLMRTGGEDHATFLGQSNKEAAWFKLGAKTPIVAASVTNAAEQIFAATDSGRTEITITPQAWLAARIHGLAPELSQNFAALANRFALPSPQSQTPQPAS